MNPFWFWGIIIVAVSMLYYLLLDEPESLPQMASETVQPVTESPIELPPQVVIEYVAETNETTRASVPPRPAIRMARQTESNRTVQAIEEFQADDWKGGADNELRSMLGLSRSATGKFELGYSCFDNNTTIGIHDGYDKAYVYGYVDSDEFIMEYIRPERNSQSCMLELYIVGTKEYVPLFQIRLEEVAPGSYNMLTINSSDAENFRFLKDMYAPPDYWGQRR